MNKGKNALYIALRLLIIVFIASLFLPDLNPARVSASINRNLSLFTTGLLYKSLVEGLGRILKKGWIPEEAMKLVHHASALCLIASVAVAAGGCLSLGNIKAKFMGGISAMIGSFMAFFGVLRMISAQKMLIASSQEFPKYTDKIAVQFPRGIPFFLGVTALIFALSLLLLLISPLPKKDDKIEIEDRYKLFIMFMPFAALLFVFCYLPLWGWRYAFFDYHAGDTLSFDKFKGFYWFTYLFSNPATAKHIAIVMRNTLAMSGIGILMSWCPMMFAVLLTEIKAGWIKQIVQSLTTIPNFISWVLVYAVAFCIFSTDGFISNLFVDLGIWSQGKNLLMDSSHTWAKMFLWGLWKGLGWSAIIYISAISGIDQQLYEAATVDGANRFQKMFNITLPSLIPTYCVLLTLQIAGVLSNGMEQYLCFENPQNTGAIEVLDLYVYKIGINGGLIPLSTVVGMLKSIISVALLFMANTISKVIRGQGVI